MWNKKNKQDNLDLYYFFFKITKKERRKIRVWFKNQIPNNYKESEFLEFIEAALDNISYDYEISTIEASDCKDGIQFVKDKKIAEHSCDQWIRLAKEYNPKKGSRLANLYELFLWYALRCVDEYWTLDNIVNDSSKCGNYLNSINGSGNIENAGIRKCGGFYDGQGNTYKIVTDPKKENEFIICGGTYGDTGSVYPIADFESFSNDDSIQDFSVGVIVLTENL